MKYQLVVALSVLAVFTVVNGHLTAEKHQHEKKAVHHDAHAGKSHDAHHDVHHEKPDNKCACSDITAIRCETKRLQQRLLRLKKIAQEHHKHKTPKPIVDPPAPPAPIVDPPAPPAPVVDPPAPPAPIVDPPAPPAPPAQVETTTEATTPAPTAAPISNPYI